MKNMCLNMENIHINNVLFGNKTEIENGTLYVNKDEMLTYLNDPFFSFMDIDIVYPGDSVRIIPVKDVIEPRIKASPKGGSFPGFFGRYEECGEGNTKVLKGCAVVTTGTIVGFQEGIIDMSGVGAEYCYFSKLINIVLTANTPPNVNPTQHEKAVRVLGLKAAHYLAQAALSTPADEIESYELKQVSEPLPKLGIIYMLMCQGLIHDNYLYGVDAKRLHTTLLHPNEILDGAIVNGTCVVAADKNTTYDHQNNPLIKELYKRHGKDLDFRGCIIVPTYTTLDDKIRCSTSAVRLARLLGLDGVVIPEEGGGNPETDLMMMIKGCENNGIKTVGLVTAIGGEEGISDVTKEADAMINVGSDEMNLILPPMEKVIGDPRQVEVLSGGFKGSLREDGSMEVNILAIMGACNQMGMTNLTSKVI